MWVGLLRVNCKLKHLLISFCFLPNCTDHGMSMTVMSCHAGKRPVHRLAVVQQLIVLAAVSQCCRLITDLHRHVSDHRQCHPFHLQHHVFKVILGVKTVVLVVLREQKKDATKWSLHT